MTKAKTFAVLLAVAALGIAAPLAQAATTTALLEVPYGLGPSTNAAGLGRDTSVIFVPGEDHCNKGLASGTRILKQYQHVYIADWDTTPMMADILTGGALMTGPLLGQPSAGTYGWGAYGPTYHLAMKPRASTTVNDNGTPLDPLDDFINPVSESDWPVPGNMLPISISSIWSSEDWFEGPGDSFTQYNWPVDQYAATAWYAGDTIIGGMEIPWAFPGGGDDGTGNPWPAYPDCTLIETFHTMGDYKFYPDPDPLDPTKGWDPQNGVPKTPTNSLTLDMDSSRFALVDLNATPADPLDDTWWSEYWEVQLDQAMIDDMFNNPDNRGMAFWDQWPWAGPNGPIYSADQNSSHWPYIYARIDVCDGDANLDEAVDGLDYVIWSNNYQLNAGLNTWLEGDYTGEGDIDGLDYVVWSNNYQTCPTVPGVVPEPATMVLLAMGAVALIRRRR